MSAVVNVMADLLLGVLLVAAIVSSVALSRRIARLKADESAMRRTVAELMLATETAERAIAGLRTAERYAADLAEQVAAGETVMSRIARIVESSRAAAAMEPVPTPAVKPREDRLNAAADAAQKLAERAARRLEGRAA